MTVEYAKADTNDILMRFTVENRATDMAELRLLPPENLRLRKAIADLTLEKLILKEAASENW